MENPYVFLDISIDGDPFERMVFELFYDFAPKTAENFRALCTGEKGLCVRTNKPLHYKGTFFHRIISGSMAQAGDLEKSGGKCGESMYREFTDEKSNLLHNDAGLLSMAIADRDTHGSFFTITFKANPDLNRKNIVFGKVVKGHDVLKKIEACGDENGKPVLTVKIIRSGETSRASVQKERSELRNVKDDKSKKRKRSKRERSKHGEKRERKREKRHDKRSKPKKSSKYGRKRRKKYDRSKSESESDSDISSTPTDISSTSYDKSKRSKRSKRGRSKSGEKSAPKDKRKSALGGGSETGAHDDTGGALCKHDQKPQFAVQTERSEVRNVKDDKSRKRERSKRERSKHGEKRERKREKRHDKRSKPKKSSKYGRKRRKKYNRSESESESDSDLSSTPTDISSTSDDKSKRSKRSKRGRSKSGEKSAPKDKRKRSALGGGSETGASDDTGGAVRNNDRKPQFAVGVGGAKREITVRAKERYICKSFESYERMHLNHELLKCILDQGTNEPSLAEQRGIVPLLSGKNFVHMVSSSDDRVKTLCYGVLGRVNCKDPSCQVLILAPNQNSANTVKKFLVNLGQSLNVKVAGCMNIINEIHTNCHVYVDTPANVSHLLNKNSLKCFRIISLILESPDQLIGSEYKSEICNIFRLLPSGTQVGIFFSNYVMSLDFLRFSREILIKDSTYFISRKIGGSFEGVDVVDDQLSCGSAKQYYMDVHNADENAEEKLLKLLEKGTRRSIVYVDHNSYDKLKDKFRDEHFPVSFIRRKLDFPSYLGLSRVRILEAITEEIENKMQQLIEGKIKMLITTDESNLKIIDDMVVINYDLPIKPSGYMKRIGLREQHNYVVINFIRENNDMDFYEIQDYYNLVIGCIPPELERELFGDRISRES